MMTLKEAFEDWKENIRPSVIEQYSEDDEPALAESWSDYTDALCTDGEIGRLQYHYCPAEDDPMPDDDREFILDAMDVSMTYRRVPYRHDGVHSQWDNTASHWEITLIRGERRFIIEDSMGSAHTPPPCREDVLNCLLLDARAGELDFDDFVSDVGYETGEPEDRRRALRMHQACKDQRRNMRSLFTPQELEDLGQLFEDY